uniref:FHA domain-containing protein n=1 Tax=Dicentrarchus labrax TaxID=13489 RepID=A0A8C4IKC3_DICLA
MPLHGKIVVVKRSGGDGTEFPLTATCLFGRKPDCDIRIQLPQVSKEHCRIDLNENKEVILTNLSSVNPTRVNGEALQQSERLKHGDLITIIDRSFRFEYPPAPTPKKRSSIGGKTETFKVLKDQQVGDTVTTEAGEKRISEVHTDPHLKDGTNHDNIQRSLEKTMELESKGDDSLLQNKTASPFNDLYQMIKKSLDVKTPRKSSASLLQTPTSRFCTPKPCSVRKNDGKPATSTEDKSTPKKDEAKVTSGADETTEEAENISKGTPKSVKKQRKSFQVPNTEMARPEAENSATPEAPSAQKKSRATPQRFTVSEVIEQVSTETPKSPMRRRSKDATPAKPSVASPKTEPVRKASPRNSGKVEKVQEKAKKRESGELAADLPSQQMKKKRVSFGGQLSPELFDKRLPPDSPLCKGAAPRRSLCLLKPKLSLLRRASAIGLLQESPKTGTPSPKKSSAKNASPKTPTPGKNSPKSRSPSPKAATPAQKSPKSRTPSPKAATPANKSPKSKNPSPSRNKVETPKASKQPTPGVQTPTVQGRFSVSRISTPSPVAEEAVTEVTVTPKLPLRRKSMKSASRKTPSMAKSAVKVMLRRSGVSRASMKVKSSWADTVKFGQSKAQVVVPAKKTVTKKTVKKAVSKPQTPARKLIDHVSTGHANSPVTIVVGRAHKQNVVHSTGAAPRLVTNTALPKKSMKMDEDLTGLSEMYKTPVNVRMRSAIINENSAMKTPMIGLGTSVVEPSVLNTPEEPDEMMVSPLSVSSTVKDVKYSNEAVQRFLNGDQESSFVSAIPAMETHSDDSGEPQCTDLKTTSVTTPKQKPELPECLTGVKRIMKTPRQKAEPVEDLRGRLLKTPKQKPQQQECLTGVKRIMKTPRQKAEPVEDLRGNILKTPKQKPEQQECLTGVKRIFETPQQEAELFEDLQENALKTPKALDAGDASLVAVKEIVETPAHMQESEIKDLKTPNVKSSPLVCLTGIKRIMKTPKEKSAAVEDFEGLQELMEEPLSDPTGQTETHEVEDQTPDCDTDVAKEADANEVVGDDHLQEVPSVQNESSEAMETLSQAAVDENLPVDAVHETVSEEQPKVETATGNVSEMETTATDIDHEKKPVRGRRAKTVESKSPDDEQEATEHSEDPVVPTPVRGRRGKKTEAAAPPAVRQTTRSRNAKTTESKDAELAMEKTASVPSKVDLKPKRGRNAKKASDDQAEMVQEFAAETETVPEPESEQSVPVDVNHEANEAPLEKAVLKPKRGRKTKQPVPEQEDVPCTHSDNVPNADAAKESESNEVYSDQLEVAPSGSDENKSSDVMDTQAPATESLPEVETCTVTEMDAAVVQKKSVRGRRAKVVESKDPVVPAPVRGRRGKKTEATAPPAVRQTSRRKNAKSQESTSDQPEMLPEKAVETLVTENSNEAVSDQTSPINTHQDENDCVPPAEEAVVKPIRGRKTKPTPVEPPQPEQEKSEVVSDEQLMAEAQPQKTNSTLGKPRRGRKTKPDPVEENEVAEDTVVTVETKPLSQPPVRAKRGRNTKQEEEKLENDEKTTSAETAKSQEPVKKLRRTRKAEPEHVEPREEVQTVEVVPEEPKAPLVAEPVKMDEQATVAAKPRRGGRKAKADTESESPAEFTEVQEIPTVSSTDKPKRGRRGKQVAVVPEEKPELEAEEQKTAELDAPVIKHSRARGVKNEVSQAIPAKRAHRGATLPVKETNAESTVQVSEAAPASVEPAKRGRRAAAKPTTDDASPTEDLSNAVVEDTKMSKRSVKWKSDLEVFNIPKGTPVKAVRGRKSKLGDQVESKNVSEDASKTEEKDLSDKVVEAQPAKRARRGAKVADVTIDEAESTSEVKGVEAETQPKTRRGRSVKK